MAIDWKTIISEFDGKPTLLQAIGKLRKAVEDETITIQQAQAEIAKLESQQKADEALITEAKSTADEAKINAYNASQKGDQALGKATTADTKAQNAQSAAQAADTKAQQAQSAAQAADTKAQQALDLAQAKTYRHEIAYLNVSSDIFGYSTIYSSKNLQCGSLSDLKTLLGDNFHIAAYPVSNFIINNWIPLSLDNSHMMILVHGSVDMNKLGYDAFTITDTVTTI